MIFVNATEIPEVKIFEFPRVQDSRGWFQRAFSADEISAEIGTDFAVAQANVATSNVPGTVRGMHAQQAPFGEMKLIRCTRGSIFDVAVDLRAGSATFGQWVGRELSEANGLSLLIPVGFAHGYMSLEDSSQVAYMTSTRYHPESEIAVSPMHSQLAIQWPMAINEISDKDASADPHAELPRLSASA